MNRGRYRHIIQFNAYSDVSDGQGGVTTTSAILTSQWANVRPLSGDRLMRMQQLIMGQWYEIETNYRADLAASISAGNPIIFGTRSLIVKTFQNEAEENSTWIFLAYENKDYVAPEIIPTFTQIGPLVIDSVAPDLPILDLIGISGTWLPATIDTTELGDTVYTFTPDSGHNATTTTMTITIEAA